MGIEQAKSDRMHSTKLDYWKNVKIEYAAISGNDTPWSILEGNQIL